ncbi:MAG: AAA family ATPase [Rhodococcus sp.]|nr:AAA family ATPase [Rhodococcus sp. (in: high G+C Gram-positive bacteria)]MBJ7322843.1 AAA family ATPase [Rhodococcus sp. (in: high G+C Gram-positive bacteria)]
MHLERVTLTNFQCFGPSPHTITFDKRLTALLGVNASGKTAALQALLRLFSVVADQRDIRVEDFHVPHDETEAATVRTLRVDTVFAFPELATDSSLDAGNGNADEVGANATATVPEFFAQMAADSEGQLKLRIVLDATWTADGSASGLIEDQRRIAYTFDDDFEDQCVDLRASDRNRIQAVYVPATRDGSRQVSSFLKGRLWRASTWSEGFRDHITSAANDLSDKFKTEAVVATVTEAIATRWQELHHLSTDQNPTFEPITRDMTLLVSNAEMLFEPTATGRTRSARELSDGQQSLLHIALTAATLDLESEIALGKHDDKFDMMATALPTLTLLAIEEPENNLSPYFLSRVVEQLLAVTVSGRAQALISSHSASVMSRIPPDRVRHFRIDETLRSTAVSRIVLPDDATDAGKYIREAVRAHPELYFARFVVLGEGASEELVIPKLAAARNLHIDQSFVAVVALGGRHTNHFWRLLNQLNIPHATLLDLDYGRDGAGEGRIRDACNRLLESGRSPFDGSEAVSGFAKVEDIDALTTDQLETWIKHLEKWDVYFSAPLDLDLELLARYKSAYTDHLEDGKTGPSSKGDPRDSVLGDPEDRPDVTLYDSADKMDLLRWYRYLFLSNSKPSTHLRALSFVSKDELAKPPPRLSRLLDRIEKAVTPS